MLPIASPVASQTPDVPADRGVAGASLPGRRHERERESLQKGARVARKGTMSRDLRCADPALPAPVGAWCAAPVSTAALLGFVLVALLGVLTPGLDTMVTLRHSILSGRRAGTGVVAGVSLGCLTWGTASIVGLSALLAASELAYRTLQIAGAAYLIWLGGSALRRTFVRRETPASAPEAPVGGMVHGLRAGLLTNLLNPKVGVFYMSLLPQFLPAGPATSAWGVLLVALHVVLGIGWLGTLVLLADRARRILLRERVRRWLDRTTAGVLVGLGVAMVADAR